MKDTDLLSTTCFGGPVDKILISKGKVFLFERLAGRDCMVAGFDVSDKYNPERIR